DVSSGDCHQDAQGPSQFRLAFLHDSARLALVSSNHTVKIWDASSSACLQMLSIGKALHRISFNISNSYLYTEIGTIEISALSSSRILPVGGKQQWLNYINNSPQYQGIALSADSVWLTYGSGGLVWLPSEYQPSCSAVLGKTIGIGVRTRYHGMQKFSLTHPKALDRLCRDNLLSY
ncbi:hypothetical protein CC80DRAFT_585089, partial [Byssothecium circinans]